VRILVTGANGMLGSSMIPTLAAAGHDVFPTDIRVPDDRPWGAKGPQLTYLDVRSKADIDDGFRRVKPEFVVHLAAETDLEVCEGTPEHAYSTNALATKHVALACQSAGLELAYISTAGVFDGKKEDAYNEYDQPNPINLYGGTKLFGEHYVQSFLQRYYIVRAGWMVGGAEKDHKFVAKILEQLRNGNRKVFAVGDRLGTPTYAPDFSRCFTNLISTGSYGLYHMACHGRASRYDVAGKILQVLGRADDVELVEVDSAYFSESYPAPRPRSETMRNLNLELQGMDMMRPWEEALEEYLKVAFADLNAGSRLEVTGVAAS
jgi:dTDP-4-dehydrorhamnose reductase